MNTVRYYAVRRVSEGMGGGSVFHAVLEVEPTPEPNLTSRQVDPATELFGWRVRLPGDEEPSAYMPPPDS